MPLSTALSPDNFHRILNQDSFPTNEGLLEKKRDIRKLRKKLKKKSPVDLTSPTGHEQVYEPSDKTRNTMGPREKSGPYTDKGFPGDYVKQPNMEHDLEKYRRNKPSTPRPSRNPKKRIQKKSQSLSSFIGQIENSSVGIYATYGEDTNWSAGFFINKNHIVTCAHVLHLGYDRTHNNDVQSNSQVVITYMGQEYSASIYAYNINLDVAVLYVDSVTYGISESIYPINLGNSGTVNKGDFVIVLGNPVKTLGTVKQGIVANETDYHLILDVTVLPGDSGGMIYSIDKQAVVGVAAAYIYPEEDQTGRANSMGSGIKIDLIKEFLKSVQVKFTYHESNHNATDDVHFQKEAVKWPFRKERTTYEDRDKEQKMKDDSVGGGTGPGKQDIGKDPHAGEEYRVPTKVPKSTRPTRLYPFSWESINSDPFSKVDTEIKEMPSIKNRQEQYEESKGKWLFNIPLGYGYSGKNNISIYIVNNTDYLAYYHGHPIMSSKKGNDNPKPLLSLIKKLKERFEFDKTYTDYIDEYGPILTS